jgi:hypothetical protein
VLRVSLVTSVQLTMLSSWVVILTGCKSHLGTQLFASKDVCNAAAVDVDVETEVL